MPTQSNIAAFYMHFYMHKDPQDPSLGTGVFNNEVQSIAAKVASGRRDSSARVAERIFPRCFPLLFGMTIHILPDILCGMWLYYTGRCCTGEGTQSPINKGPVDFPGCSRTLEKRTLSPLAARGLRIRVWV